MIESIGILYIVIAIALCAVAARKLATRAQLVDQVDHTETLGRVTPERARAVRPDSRERARKLMAEFVDEFVASGDNVLVIDVDPGDTAMILELLEYRSLGWDVDFIPGAAVLSLPAVLS